MRKGVHWCDSGLVIEIFSFGRHGHGTQTDPRQPKIPEVPTKKSRIYEVMITLQAHTISY